MTAQPTPSQNSPQVKIRIGGAVLACTTPISGFISYALLATLIGESRLEGAGGEGGLTTLGWLAVTAPALAGLILILISFLNVQIALPDRRIIGAGLAALSVVLVIAGLWSTTTTSVGDANIGGGLLILSAIPTAIAAVFWIRPKNKAIPHTLT